MKILPSEKLLLQTPLTKALVLERLSDCVLSQGCNMVMLNDDDIIFEGQLQNNTFIFKRSITNSSMYFPEITGEFHEADNGTEITLSLKPQSNVTKFMALWLAGVTLGIFVITLAGFYEGGSKIAILIPSILLATGAGLINAGFNNENKKARTALTKILDAEIKW